MPRTTTARKYGKPSKRTKAERLFAELPQSPVRQPAVAAMDDAVNCITEQLSVIRIEDKSQSKPCRRSVRGSIQSTPNAKDASAADGKCAEVDKIQQARDLPSEASQQDVASEGSLSEEVCQESSLVNLQRQTSLEVLNWDDVCPPGDRIVKIAEASYAEVYRVTNERGTSIIKVIRLDSPIKAKTKAQIKAGLVDEEPHAEADVDGELQISEWLADIPGFVVYKKRYLVQGKASRQLLETHQVFQKRMKRQDPGRAQFYPSPSRYFDETKFLVVELGDAGTALEDWELADESQLWDIFFLEAIALARAEDLAMFEV